MNISIKFEYFPIKNMFGKKTGKLVAHVGDAEIEAKTKEELQEQAQRFIGQKTKFGTEVFSYRNHSIVIYMGNDVDCWGYTIVHPDTSGKSYSSTYGGGSYSKFVSGAIRHLLDMTRKPGEFAVPEWAKSYVDEQEIYEYWRNIDSLQKC